MTAEDPLVYECFVACRPEHAFGVWTDRLDAWWPKDHTQSGDAGSRMELDGRVGGRILERAPSGATYEWGVITGWEPPHLIRFDWFPAADPGLATSVEIRFSPVGDKTEIRLVHTGWERFGAEAEQRRQRNQQGWDHTWPHFERAVARAVDP